MTMRDWAMDKLYEDEYGTRTNVRSVDREGEHGLVVSRADLRMARLYCAESSTEPFRPTDLQEALVEMPALEFVVVIKRAIANDTYTHADARDVGIGGLNALLQALRTEDDIGAYRSKNHQFVQSRLSANKYVATWRRRGYDAYEVERPRGLRSLVVVTINPYEVTQEQAYRLINQHAELDLEAIVTTNPNCRGFSSATLEAVANAGVRIMTFSDFLGSLGEEWAD